MTRMDSFVGLGIIVFVLCISSIIVNGEAYCSDMYYTPCLNGKCIPKQWACDGADDCGDGSDESQCEVRACNAELEFSCRNSSQCIPDKWRCDSDADCDDRSDEENCAGAKCQDGHFDCGIFNGSLSCIPDEWKCDGHPDCRGGLDESPDNCRDMICYEDEFQCLSNKHCISKRWLCDHDIDCPDGSDEHNCTEVASCMAGQWKCLTGSQCIPTAWACDGSYDCADRSDETNCSTSSSTSGHCDDISEFYCPTSRECIHKAWVCDMDKDCADESDEKNCGHLTCLPNHFQCTSSGRCIPEHLRCDGVDHCGDASDETACDDETFSCDALTEFKCHAVASQTAASHNDTSHTDISHTDASHHHCIPLDAVCDGHDDCIDGLDENATVCAAAKHVDKCKIDNGGCSDECVVTYVGYFCRCPDGYQLADDHKTCEDIDECSLPGYCSQHCENKVGGFKCSCNAGYELDPEDSVTCRAVGGEPFLLFANRHDLRQLHLYSGRYRSLLDGMHSAIAIDFEVASRTLFWSDVTSENIGLVTLDERGVPRAHKVLVSDDIHTPDGLAYDWIHKNLYWTDTGRDSIDVISLGGAKNWRRTLVSTGLDEPRAIIVDPRDKHRLMYWTDWGRVPKIERANLDGSGRHVLVSDDIMWPNGLTIDYESNRLFWVDAKLHIIASSDLIGQNRQVILTSYTHLRHPFAITVFEDDVYWSDWQAKSIMKVNKQRTVSGSDVHQVAEQLLSPMDIRIYHKLKQPHSENACEGRSCSHICLPTPDYPGYTCACPNDRPGAVYALDRDLATCLLNSQRSNEVTSRPDAGRTEVNSESTTPVRATPESRQQSTSSSQTIVILVVIIVLIVVLILAILAAILVRRYIRMKNVKTMNFDNPVYRKTTEEDFSLKKPAHQHVRKVPSLLKPLTSQMHETV